MKIVRLTAVTSMAVVMLAGLTLSFSAKTVLAGTVVRDHRGVRQGPCRPPRPVLTIAVQDTARVAASVSMV